MDGGNRTMKIMVKDAFDATVGYATVEWFPVYGTGPEESTRVIFPEDMQVVNLPTRNAAMPWRLEVYPTL
jgi:hypothetical protein